MKKLLILILSAISTIALVGCESDAATASKNMSKAADQFEIQRRIVFYNGITGEYMLELEGKCSVELSGSDFKTICKTGPNTFKKHYLGLSDNVTYFAEQIDGVKASVYHNRIIWKPQIIIPNIDINGSSKDFVENVVNK